MPAFDFEKWPPDFTTGPFVIGERAKQVDRKPFDRQMPFHRIRVPGNQFIPPPGRRDRNNPPPNFVPAQRIITGDAYSRGARSTKDYDGKFGEDLARDLADVVQNIFPPLQAANLIAKGVSKGLGFLIGLIPGTKKAAEFLDNLDPLKDFFGLLGNAADNLIFDSFIRSVPAWVPVFDETLNPQVQINELDGILIRSHQRFDSVPFWQWHRWYDWHFAVSPSPIFSELVGFGNTHRDDDNKLGEPQGSTLTNYHKEGLPANATVSANAIADCEWDIGAIGLRSGPIKRDANGKVVPSEIFPSFFEELQPRKPHDWCWPMTGMFFWAIGRSVYDCSHATANNGRRTKKKDRLPQGSSFSEDERVQRGVHLNQLHPLKAIATARWEAFKFDENPRHVPAIQFMFYGNTHLSSAGFFGKDQPHTSGFPPLGDQDYEFIVDLPTAVITHKDEYPIGHTPEFPVNTLVLGPRLLVNANFVPFADGVAGNSSGGVMEDAADREKFEVLAAKAPKPVVEIFGQQPNQPPQQALVKIPLKGKLSQATNTYGVLLSMGWFDPDATQVDNVKKVTVKLLSVQPAGDTHDDATEGEWNINVGVNGRWFQFRFVVQSDGSRIHLGPNPGKNQAAAGAPPEVEMFLAKEDLVMVSVHGMEEDAFDDLIRKPPEVSDRPRPQKKAPKLDAPPTDLDINKLKEFTEKIAKFKKDSLERLRVLEDRLLRHATTVDVPTGTPDPKTGKIPTTQVQVPMVGDEIEWDTDIDTDDDKIASRTARAMFLRMAIGNHFDANDPLGMIDANLPDPTHKSPPNPRSQAATDTPNPLVVSELMIKANEKSPGVFVKSCQLSAYATSVVGRMGALAYDGQKLDYTFFYEVKVEDLPKTQT
jgi:hypothetical protein